MYSEKKTVLASLCRPIVVIVTTLNIAFKLDILSVATRLLIETDQVRVVQGMFVEM